MLAQFYIYKVIVYSRFCFRFLLEMELYKREIIGHYFYLTWRPSYYFVIIKFDNRILSSKANTSQCFVYVKINVYSIQVGPSSQNIYC